jgi:hypothetical protein
VPIQRDAGGVKVKKEQCEIVGMIGDHELQADEKEHELRTGSCRVHLLLRASLSGGARVLTARTRACASRCRSAAGQARQLAGQGGKVPPQQ